jgi:hypothetical protein
MSKRNHFWLTAVPLVMLATTFVVAADPAGSPPSSNLVTYDSPAGETFFALSLHPTEQIPATGGHDIAVLFDTSASQTGAYRDDALKALKSMLTSLGPDDRVKLMAMDLNSVAMTEGFVAPGSEALQAGLAKLERRVPLGSTDMQKGLRGAADSFTGPASRPRAAVYLGDGHSRASLLHASGMDSLVQDLPPSRFPFPAMRSARVAT